MAIVAGFDVHRAQITFDALDRETGEVKRGRIPAAPEAVRRWAWRFAGEEVHVAVEACTGWLFVCEALVEAGAIPHLAEPVETSALRGKKRRARPRGRQVAADAALRGPAAGGLDPAGARA
jgi:transposase